MCTVHSLTESTILERSTIKIIQLNTKYKNRKYHQTKCMYIQLVYQDHATLDTWQQVLPTQYTQLFKK